MKHKLDGITARTRQQQPPAPPGPHALLRSYEAQQKAQAQAAREREMRFESWRREISTGKSRWFKDFEHGPEMVVVPAGSFTMGSNEDESEKPPHKVTINAPFAVGRFAITFEEWGVAGLPYKPGDQGWGWHYRRPVINVSWEDAQSYAAWISQNTGKPYRLLRAGAPFPVPPLADEQ